MAGVHLHPPIRKYPRVSPLILSFSPREKGRLNEPRSVQPRSLSQWERDKVRGGTFDLDALWYVFR